ncbi:MAG: pseudouridine synthase [Pseudohongiellaceae bacterium]
MPLARALSKLGLASRGQTLEWIAAGRLAVNGRICRNPDLRVVPERDRFALDGVTLARQQRFCVLLHKPRGYVTTRSDEKGRKTVFDLLPASLQQLHAVGRLDMHTSGLLLLTNDTRLSSYLTDPANGVPREYAVSVEGKVEAASLQRLREGIEDKGELLQAAAVRVRKLSGRESHLFVTLQEGRNREVRRLFDAIGHPVTKLKRIAFGPLLLGELASGTYRELDAAEVDALQHAGAAAKY